MKVSDWVLGIVSSTIAFCLLAYLALLFENTRAGFLKGLLVIAAVEFLAYLQFRRGKYSYKMLVFLVMFSAMCIVGSIGFMAAAMMAPS